MGVLEHICPWPLGNVLEVLYMRSSTHPQHLSLLCDFIVVVREKSHLFHKVADLVFAGPS